MNVTTQKLRDGTLFKIGMTLVTEMGREIRTDDEFEVVETSIQRKGSKVSWPLSRFYCSQQSRINSQVAQLRAMISEIEDEISFLKANGSPKNCSYIRKGFQ